MRVEFEIIIKNVNYFIRVNELNYALTRHARKDVADLVQNTFSVNIGRKRLRPHTPVTLIKWHISSIINHEYNLIYLKHK